MGMQQNKVLILVLSVICKKENETYAIPLKIRIYTMEPRMTMLPDVFLFYDETVFINPDFKYVKDNRIVTPLMKNWNQRIDRGLKLLIDDLISVFSECPPLLHTKESLIPNSDITHRMHTLHSPRELQTGKADRPGSLWNGIS
ncbi:hypothetical protein AV274_3740, partial [Blastocystis sp. ATCC 50177/Nand II]